jgi:hypothetical protein
MELRVTMSHLTAAAQRCQAWERLSPSGSRSEGTLCNTPRDKRRYVENVVRIYVGPCDVPYLDAIAHPFNTGNTNPAALSEDYPEPLLRERDDSLRGVHANRFESLEKSPVTDTVPIELANGSKGFPPSSEQRKLDGYETLLTINRVEKDASPNIVTKLLELSAVVRK